MYHTTFGQRFYSYCAYLLVATFLLLVTSSSAFAIPGFSKGFSPSEIGSGSTSTLTLTITNPDLAPISNVAFTDSFTGNLIIANPSNAVTNCTNGILTATDGGTTVTLSSARLPGGATCTVSLNVTSTTTETNTTGDLTSSEGNSGTASAILTVNNSRPGFNKSFSPSTIPLGGTSTLTFNIINDSAVGISTLNFSDQLPSGMIIASPSNASTNCGASVFPATLTSTSGTSSVSLFANGFLPSFPALEASSSCTVSVDVTTNTTGVFLNTSSELVSGSPSVSSGFATATLNVPVEFLVKSFSDDPVPPGGTVTLQFTVNNLDRNFAASNIAFTDDLDATLSGLVATDLPESDVCGTGSTLSGTSNISLTGGNLPAAGSCTFSVVLQVPTAASPGTFPNTTSAITADVGGAMVTGNTAADNLVVSIAPVLIKSFSDDPVGAGGTTTLSFTLSNPSSSSALTDINFTDEFDSILKTAVTVPGANFCNGTGTATFTPFINGSNGSSNSPAKLFISGADLAAGASCSFSITLNVATGATAGTYPNTTSDVSALSGAQTVTGLPASDDLVVVAGPTLSKSFTNDPVQPGDSVTLEFTLTHDALASNDATAIGFTDDLSAVLAGLAATGLPQNDVCGTGSVLSGTTSLTLTGGLLTPGASCTFSATLQVPAGAIAGSYTNNTSNVTATVGGVSTVGNVATDDLKIAGLVLTKVFTNDPVLPGATVDLEFTIENLSTTETATNIIFTDSLSSTLTGLTAITLPPTGACGAGSALSGTSFLIFTGGTLAPSSTCTFTATLQVPVGAADGTYSNVTGNLTANLGANSVVLDPAADSLVVQSDLLLLSKEFTDDPIKPGDTVTLEFTVTNQNATQAVTGITFTDDLDAAASGLAAIGLPAVNVCGAGSQISGTGLLILTGADLAGGSSCTFSVTLQVPTGLVPNIYTNTTNAISGMVGGIGVTGNAASDDLVVNGLTLTKSFDGPTTAPGTPTLTFTISNESTTLSSTELAFTDDLNSVLSGLVATGLPLSDICGAGSQISGSAFLTFNGGSLLPGGSCTFTVPLQVPSTALDGTFSNTTSDLSQGGLTVGAPATADLTVIPTADISLSKSDSVDPIIAGNNLTYTVTATNNGPSDALNVVVTDTLPAGVTFISSSGCAEDPNGVPTCSLGTITAGTSAQYNLTVTVDSATSGNITNQVSVTSSTQLVNLVDDSVSETTTVSSEADLTLTKSDSTDPIIAGNNTLIYTITATNNGPSDALNVVVADTLPAGVTLVSTAGCAEDPSAVPNCSLGTIDEGTSKQYSITVAVNPSTSGTITNNASVSSNTTLINTGDDSVAESTSVLASADLSVSKTDGVTSATPGGSVTYTIVAANAGPSDDPSVTLSDTFPTSLSCAYTSVAAGGTSGHTASGSGNLSETLSMPAGSSVTYTAVCGIAASATGTLSNTATVTASVTDSNVTNNSATDNNTVLGASADISVTKTDGVTSATPGGSVTYTIVAANAGPSDDPSVSLSDTFPTSLSCAYTSVAAGGASGHTASGSGNLSETLSMPAGSSVTYTAVCGIAASATGTLSNTATVTASVTDSNATNNSATDNDTVLGASADISVTKTDGVTSATPGGSVTYTIVAANAGPSDDPSVTLSDTFPTSLSCAYTSVAAGGASGHTASGSGNLSETLSMPAGSSVTYTAVCGIAASATGTLSNTATVTASVTDSNATNNSATDNDTVLVIVIIPVRSFTGPLFSGTAGTISFTTPDPTCSFISDPQFIDDASFVPAPPANLEFVDGLISFVIENCELGATVNLTVDYGQILDPAVENWKSGTPWFVLPSTISGSTMSYSITDGGLGDEDTIPGRITDPHGAALAKAAAIPTNNTLGILLLVILLMLSGLMARRYGYTR